MSVSSASRDARASRSSAVAPKSPMFMVPPPRNGERGSFSSMLLVLLLLLLLGLSDAIVAMLMVSGYLYCICIMSCRALYVLCATYHSFVAISMGFSDTSSFIQIIYHYLCNYISYDTN